MEQFVSSNMPSNLGSKLPTSEACLVCADTETIGVLRRGTKSGFDTLKEKAQQRKELQDHVNSKAIDRIEKAQWVKEDDMVQRG